MTQTYTYICAAFKQLHDYGIHIRIFFFFYQIYFEKNKQTKNRHYMRHILVLL